MSQLDPLRLDRELRAAADAWRSWRRALRQSPETAQATNPFVFHRRITGKDCFEELGELSDSDPLREPLRRWVYRLAEQRINQHVIGELYRVRRSLVSTPTPREGEWPRSELLLRALQEAPQREWWLEQLRSHSKPVHDVVVLLWERRQEIARRMGLDNPDQVVAPHPDVAGFAQRWLQRSQDLLASLEIRSVAQWLEVALATSASDGWPAQLNPHNLQALLGGPNADLLRKLELDPGHLPRPIAQASFLRALARVGAAWDDAAAPTHQPFVIAHDPYGRRRFEHGALFAGLALSPAFAQRRLGLSRDRSRSQLRAAAAAVLLASRVAAFRVLLRQSALSGGDSLRASWSERAEWALGVPWKLTAELGGSFVRIPADAEARFCGLLTAAPRSVALVETHDEDWFRNPRAQAQLRDEASLSPEPLARDEDLDLGVETLLRELAWRLE